MPHNEADRNTSSGKVGGTDVFLEAPFLLLLLPIIVRRCSLTLSDGKARPLLFSPLKWRYRESDAGVG